MNKHILPLFSLSVAAAVLAACAPQQAATSSRDEPYVIVSAPSAVAGGSAPATLSGTGLRSGAGVIESLTAVAKGTDESMWRAGVRMDDGSFQSVDTLAEGLSLGKRVDVTGDGKIASVSSAPLQLALAPVVPSAATGGTGAPQAATLVTTTTPVRAGFGRIETISAVQPGATAAGTTRPVLSQWRVGVRMDDGSTQVLDTLASGLTLGKRVEVTGDGRIQAAS